MKLEKGLRNGDGLAIRGNHEETGLVYAGPDMPSGETATIRLRPDARVKTGDTVWRLTDAAQLEAADALKGRTVPVRMYLRAMPGEALTLTATDGESYVTVNGETVAEAKTREATAEELKRNLEKTGDTVFVPEETKVETAGAFVPVSQVNAVRREALEKLAEARIEAFEREGKDPDRKISPRAPIDLNDIKREAFPAMAYVRTAEQAEAARKAGILVIRRPEDYRKEALEALKAEMQPGDWLALPDVCEEETLQELRRFTEENRELLGGVALGSVGQLGIEWPVAYGAGPAIPVMNRQAASLLAEEGCRFMTASPELTGQELKELLGCGLPIVTVVYGRTRLMLLHHCPARTALGLERGHKDCRMCDEGSPDALKGQALEDRKGYRFPLVRQRLPEGCLVELMNALPTDNMDKGIACRAVCFSTEDREEAESILEDLAAGRKSKGETTSGHWKRAVE